MYICICMYLCIHTYFLFPTVSKVHKIADKTAEMKQKYARGSIEKNHRDIQYTPKLKLKELREEM